MNTGGHLAAVITDGLTNSRLDFYEIDSMRRLERRQGWNRPSELIVDRDGRLWFDIPDAVEHFLGELEHFDLKRDVSIIVPVARGAVCGLLDRRGALLPETVEDMGGALRRGGAISYINGVSAETDALFDEMAGPRERYRSYGLPPNFAGCAIPARTIVYLANEYPELVREAAAFIFGPEIMARLLCAGASSLENEGLEPTYLMSHTGLWRDGRWSSLARSVDAFVLERTGRHLLGELMPAAPAASSRVFDRVGEAAAARCGLDKNAVVLNGGHDSTIADLPVAAAFGRAFKKREFIHLQAGSWAMARLMGVRDEDELPQEGFGKNMMFQGDLYGNPVLTASAPTGIEFQHYAGDGPSGRGVLLEELGLESLPAGRYDPLTLREVVSRRAVFITPGVAAGIGPYPESVSHVHGMEEIRGDPTGELAYIALNLETSIMATAAVELAAGRRKRAGVVLSAGAAADGLFRLLVASLNPAREVFYVADEGGVATTETASDGGFLLALEHVRGIPTSEMNVAALGYHLKRVEPDEGLVEDLASYREEFERRAEA